MRLIVCFFIGGLVGVVVGEVLGIVNKPLINHLKQTVIRRVFLKYGELNSHGSVTVISLNNLR